MNVSVIDYIAFRAFKLQSQKKKEASEFSPFFWGVFRDRYRVKKNSGFFVLTYLALFVYNLSPLTIYIVFCLEFSSCSISCFCFFLNECSDDLWQKPSSSKWGALFWGSLLVSWNEFCPCMDGYEGKDEAESCMCVCVYLIKDNMSFCVCVCVFLYKGIGSAKISLVLTQDKWYRDKPIWIIEWTLLSVHYTCTHGVLMFLIVTAWIAELIKGLKKLKMHLNCSSTTALVIGSKLWLLKLATYEIHY